MFYKEAGSELGKRVWRVCLFLIALYAVLLLTACKSDTTSPEPFNYQKYATEEQIVYTNAAGDTLYIGTRYNREFQHKVESILIGIEPNDIYDSYFFNLDDNNTAHFFEDIGKYNKYIFGWVDWYFTYAADSDGNFVLANQDGVANTDYYGVWVGMNDPNVSPIFRVWTANHSIANFQNYLLTGNEVYLQSACSPTDPLASPMRKVYWDNRQ